MQNFKCSFCGNKHTVHKKTQYIYRHDDNFLIVNDVPCEECEFCGEQYFEAEVLKRIESHFHEINAGKRKVEHLDVPVENFG